MECIRQVLNEVIGFPKHQSITKRNNKASIADQKLAPPNSTDRNESHFGVHPSRPVDETSANSTQPNSSGRYETSVNSTQTNLKVA